MTSSKWWRPPLFQSVEELEKMIDQYFIDWHRTKKVLVKTGKDEYKEVDKPMITMTGLALYLWFASRQSLYDYENDKRYSYTIKRARTFIEREYEEMLQMWLTNAIFALKNLWWKDKHETELSWWLVAKVVALPERNRDGEWSDTNTTPETTGGSV